MAMLTSTAIMLGIGLAGTTTSVVGQVRAGNAAKKAGEAQQQAANSTGELHDYNAAVAELQADDAIDRGAEQEARFRTMVRASIGSQRVGFAASNIDVNFGSAVDVQADAAMLGELDALTIRTNAAREAWGYKVQAEDYRKRADISRKEGVYLEKAGGAARTSAYIGAAGSAFSGSASLLEARYGFGRAGR